MEARGSFQERRKAPRRPIVGMRLESQTLRGRIVDVSSHGIGIETPLRVRPDQNHSVKIVYSGQTMMAKARVCWSEQCEEVDVGLSPVQVFRIGVELERIPPRPSYRRQA